MNNELSEVMFERVFESVDADGGVGKVTLRVGKPYLKVESDISLKWRCPFQIIGIGSGTIKEAPGMDAIDALLVGLKLAEVLLSTNSITYDTTITWLGEDHLGLSFPSMPENDAELQSVRDILDSPFKNVLDNFFKNLKK